MNSENEREEYSDEMSAGRRRETLDAEFEKEVEALFSEKKEIAPVAKKERKMPIPKDRVLPKRTEKGQPIPAKPKEIARTEREESEPQKPKKQKKERSHGAAYYAFLLCLLLLCAVLLCATALRVGKGYLSEVPAEEEETQPSLETTGNEKIVFVREYDDGEGLLSLPELYETCADSVVSLRTQGKNASGIGSGFFVRDDGYLATAAHVVTGSERITAVTRDGKSFEARLVASNEMTDLALLKIEGEGFSEVTFGTSGSLLTGERVVAIGTPASLDYAGTLSVGEVTYGLRTVKIYDTSGQILQKKMRLLQTGVPVNAGNSGCPLFDEYGRVVGIVTMKIGEGFDGIGFAIPSDGASAILSAMMRGESPSEEMISAISVGIPRLGVLGEAGTVDGIAGVRIVRFSSNTCDAAIKLREGDLIIGLDGKAVASMEQMLSAVQENAPGDGILVSVLREGQRLTFEVILEKS